MKKIVIPYFPTGLKYTSPLIFGAGIYIWSIGHPAWTAVTTLLAIIFLTTNYVTEIDLGKKEYRDYLSFLGIPFGKEKNRFEEVVKIVIQKKNHSQMLNSRSRSRQIDWESFTGTLLLDNHKTPVLLTRNDKGELIRGLKQFSEFLKIDIEDQTTTRYYTVDTTTM